MADYKLIGKNYTTTDLRAKVTGGAKYAEDFRAEGMVFMKLLLSPMPHARVLNVDASAALAMPGVEGILTADDLPEVEAPGEAGLTNEPLYEGEPILAIAAVDEQTASDAIELVEIEYEPLPFCVDPLDSLRPDGPNARLEGNTMRGRELATIKWTEAEFEELAEGRLPMTGEYAAEWSVGDVEAGLAAADLVVDESLYHQSLGHQPLETRSCMAYWENGKVYVYGSTQSTARTVGAVARWAEVEPANVVLVSEFCGGGFGSKGAGSVSMRFPIVMSKKIGKPVMMRISRREENFIGRARPAVQARAKIGFRRDGRILAMDLFTIGDGGPYGRSGDHMSLANIASLAYQPESIRVRGIPVYTNTPPRTAQRAPGGEQAISMLAPLMDQAARRLGIDRTEIIRVNAPEGQATFGAPARDGRQGNVSSAFVLEALDKGMEAFNWSERMRRSGQRNGSKATGIGVALSTFSAGSSGMDGLMVLRPDGRLQIQTGVGNLGTESFSDTARAAAEALDMPWDKVELVWGATDRNLPWSAMSVGSQTTHAHTRAHWAAGLDAKRKLQEIAAHDLGGSADDYDVSDERVFRRGNRSQGMSFARAAERAVVLGGRFDGHELPEDINGMTVASANALAGRGVMGVAKDTFATGGRVMSFVVGFAEVEVDVETGAIRMVDYLGSADCGTVVHPRLLGSQIHSGGIQGFGIALSQKWVFDRRWGLSVAKRFYNNRPPGILDVPHERPMGWVTADEPDPFNPLGAKGIGEPAIGAGSGAVLCAIADALGGEGHFYRSPVTADMVLTKLEQIREPHDRLMNHV
ncbi:MAG: xanthine dehydrogenase family protein molybdopterin-binding subunit [Acidobacteriota bacterium]|nr:xanthine dehydrogenase family protein molybdopterin-binding subunit [Acidobacteriota bacterium]